ncbi:MAG: IPT/TIG domain-containing protein, partial [Planctomycetota bacterium]
MFYADISTRTMRLVLLSIAVFAVLVGGCDSGRRFGAGFGDDPTGPPIPPTPPDCISPSLNDVNPEQGSAGTELTLTGVNFSPQLEDNRVVFRSFSNNTVLD